MLGVPLLAGRDFTDDDRDGGKPVSILGQSAAQRLFLNGDAVNRHRCWTDPYFGEPVPRVATPAPSQGVVPTCP